MDLNGELMKYLSDDDKKRIAERVYEEECRRLFEEDVKSRSPIIFTDRSTVYFRILDRYIEKMELEKTDFIPYMKETLNRELKEFFEDDENDCSAFTTTLKYATGRLVDKVIDENNVELKEIIREKVFKCCNETLLIAFLSNIVRKMDLDKAVKKLIVEMEGEKA